MARTAEPAEHQALTTLGLSLAMLAWAWAPGITALPAALITYLSTVTGTAAALRWNRAHTLTGTNNVLRGYAAATIRLLALTIHAAATAALTALATAHTKTLPTP